MQQDILINWSPQETRVAVVESGAVQELHVERTLERGLVRNIYLGKVARVLPGCNRPSSTSVWSGPLSCMWPMSGSVTPREKRPRRRAVVSRWCRSKSRCSRGRR